MSTNRLFMEDYDDLDQDNHATAPGSPDSLDESHVDGSEYIILIKVLPQIEFQIVMRMSLC